MKAAVTEVPGDAAEEEEDPHPDVAPLLGEALHLVVMDLLAMMVLPTGGGTVQQETTELLQNPMTAHLQDPTTELHPSPLASLMRAGPRWPSVKPTWSSHLGRFDFSKVLLALPWPPPALRVVAL